MAPNRHPFKRFPETGHALASRISETVNGKCGITADAALRLGRYFKVTPEFWRGLQTEYDLRMARRTVGKHI